MSDSTTILTCATAPNVKFTSREELHEHYKSDWHRYNLRRRAAGLTCITKEVFDKVKATMEMKEEAKRKETGKVDHLKHPKEDRAGKKKPIAKQMEEEQQEEQEEEMDVVESEEQIEARVRKALESFQKNPLKCIFGCNPLAAEYEDISQNMKHMYDVHGFFLPDIEYVVDAPGMIGYCQEKIEIGRQCLNCNRIFQSSAACLTHMKSKGHYLIPWTYEDEVEEYAEFYEYPEETQDNGTMRVDEQTGELILTNPDGSWKRIGPGPAFKDVYREMKLEREGKLFSHAEVALQLAAPSLTRGGNHTLELYKRAGIQPNSTGLLSVSARRKIVLFKKQQGRQHQSYLKQEVNASLQHNWTIKHAKAKRNVGAGTDVHG